MFSFVAHGLPSLPGELHLASGCYLAGISVHLSTSAEGPPRATVAQLPPISLGVATSFQDWLVELKGKNDAPRFSTGYIASFGAAGALMEVPAFVLENSISEAVHLTAGAFFFGLPTQSVRD